MKCHSLITRYSWDSRDIVLNSLRRFIKTSYVNLTDERVKLSFFRWLLQKVTIPRQWISRNFLSAHTSFVFQTFQGAKNTRKSVETRAWNSRCTYSIRPFSLNFFRRFQITRCISNSLASFSKFRYFLKKRSVSRNAPLVNRILS